MDTDRNGAGKPLPEGLEWVHTHAPSPEANPRTRVLTPAVKGFSHLRGDAAYPRVPGYEITAVVGAGGMGIVYKARHRELRRTVALKTIRAAALADDEFRERFHAEAEAVARLQHPNIIQVFEVGRLAPIAGEEHAPPFIALEFVDGGNLLHCVGKISPRDAARMLEQLARAVEAAHRVGVVHRDLKPANILLTTDGEPKIADFGLAKQLETERDAAGRFQTQAGSVMGTPEYMAPEQALGLSATPAVDIYSLGVILYELLTGRPPFQAATALEIIARLQYQEPEKPRRRRPEVPRDLETICLKCLEKDPRRRYLTAGALADDLHRFLEDRPILARPTTSVGRGWRWARRNPAVAVSTALVIAIFFAAFGLVTWTAWQTDLARRDETAQRQEAQRREWAERWERYRANLVATASAFQADNVVGARHTLEAAPEEHRNWEWRHFHSRLDLAREVWTVLKEGAVEAHLRSGTRLAIFADDQGRDHLIDITTGRTVHSYDQYPHVASSLASPDGRLVPRLNPDHAITLHDVTQGRDLTVLRGLTERPHSIAFTFDSALVFATAGSTVHAWETATGRLRWVATPEKENTRFVLAHPSGSLVTAIYRGNVVRLWDAKSGREVARLVDPDQDVEGVYWEPDLGYLLTSGRFPGNLVRRWDLKTGQHVCTMRGHSNTVLAAIRSPDGTRIATASLDQTARLWDAATGSPLAVLQGHRDWVMRVCFSPDGRQVATCSRDHTVRPWDATTGAALAVLHGHTAEVCQLDYREDGVLVTLSKDGTARCWDPRRAEQGGVLRGHASFVYGVGFHPDGTTLASASWDGTVRLWDVTTSQAKAVLQPAGRPITLSVAYDPSGRLLATRSRDAVRLWDVATNREVHRWDVPGDGFRDSRVAFSPNGGLLVAGCAGRLIRVWNVATRAEVAVLRGHTDEVRDVAFSPDGRLLASAGEHEDRRIRILDVAKWTEVRALEGHGAVAYAVAFSPDGSRLASSGLDGTARLWDTATWRQVAAMRHSGNVYGVAFTPDGTRLACACADGAVHLWDVATQQEVAELRGHGAYVHQVAFSPDGTRLASASGDGTARIWDTGRPQDRAAAGP